MGATHNYLHIHHISNWLVVERQRQADGTLSRALSTSYWERAADALAELHSRSIGAMPEMGTVYTLHKTGWDGYYIGGHTAAYAVAGETWQPLVGPQVNYDSGRRPW